MAEVIQHIESNIKEGSKAIGKMKVEAIDLISELKVVTKLYTGVEGRTTLRKANELCSLVGELRWIAYKVEDTVSETMGLSFLWTDRTLHKLRMLKKRAREVKSKLAQLAQGPNPEQILLCSPASQALALAHGHADGDHVIGIDQEIKWLVDLLTGKYNYKNGEPPPVDRLAIVGMGGSGKTTLARSIYDHNAVKSHFHFRVWLSVSQGFDTILFLLEIVKQIQSQKWCFPFPFALNDYDEEQLRRKKPGELAIILNQLLFKKTCLLVLDDVWDLQSLNMFIDLIQNENHPKTWKIVITSRRNPQGQINWCIHQPQRLTDEDSWKLFSMVATNSSKPISSEYRKLPMKLQRKCDGLPLAILGLARVVKAQDGKREWQTVLNQIEEEDSTSMYGPLNENLGILGLSYDKLPYHLKLCFLYLGLFPDGSPISVGQLTRMLIAEGFIEIEQLRDGKETQEAASRRYLQELIDHSMVQVVERDCFGKPKLIRMHDMIRVFCILKARELDFLTVSSSEARGRARRAAIGLSKNLILPANSPNLRSLAIFGQSSTSEVPDRFSNPVNLEYLNLAEVCQKYKLLRVLDIVGIKTSDGTLPKEMGNLIHLTYLRIRSTNIRKLPKSVGQLTDLLTLDYRDVCVDGEITMPNVLWKLKKLRHVYLPEGMSGSIEDLKLDTLKDLITLWGVGGGFWLHKEMNKLSSTLSKLYIHGISIEDQLKTVLSSPAIMENSRLYALALNWYRFEFTISDQFSANTSLMRLKLVGNAPDKSHIQGCKFPSNLRKLELHYTQLERAETMALLGTLVFLKVLILGKDSYIGSEWSCNDQAFPVLDELKLADLPNIEKWEIEKGAFRCLKRLSIVSCIKLKGMPEGLKVVEKLNIEGMPSEFTSKYQKGEDEGRGTCFGIIKHLSEIGVSYYNMVSTFAHNLFFWR